MDAELKAKWIAALRSGEYLKGKGHLVDVDAGRFCCLGVYCAIVNPEALTRIDVWELTSTSDIARIVGPDNDIPYGTREDLAEMNDHGISFAKIADYIEANL